MNKFFSTVILCVIVSIAFGQLKVGTNGSFGTTTTDPLNFTVFNVKAGSTGSSTNLNVSFGMQALLNNTSSGLNNTAVGYNALRTNSTGDFNTAIGYSALDKNNGNNNTAIGADALAANSIGGSNSALGTGALLGMYFYSLIVNGQEIDTKRMILTK